MAGHFGDQFQLHNIKVAFFNLMSFMFFVLLHQDFPRSSTLEK